MAGVAKSTQIHLNTRLEEILNALTVLDDGFPDLEHHFHIYRFWQALSKHEPWRSHLELFDLFEVFRGFARRSGLNASPNKTVKLADALAPDAFAQCKQDIREFLLSLPRPYDVWVDLPAMPRWGPGEIALTGSMTLVHAEIPPSQQAAGGGLDALLGIPSGEVRLRIRVSGYGAPRMDTTAMADAVAQIKQFFQLFRRLEIYFEASTALGGLFTARRELSCEVIDLEFPAEKMRVQLPEGVARFVSTLSVDNAKLQAYDNSKASTLLGGTLREAVTREERVQAFTGKTAWITELLDCPHNWVDAPRIRTALEWAFDSAQNDNQTLSFLQACIGLEALLGDDDKTEPLTARLADRCAYLLGKTQHNREEIRRKFKDMYEVRSKLVHGRRPRLNIHERAQLSFAQATLGDVITDEGNRLLRALREAQQNPG